MFKTKESTPRYYTNTSRDFQLLGHLLDCIIANVRQGVDGLSKISLDKNIDDNLINLAQTSLGLNLTKNYSSKALLAICKSFKYILKLKGSQESINECVKVLLNAQYIDDEYYIEFNSTPYHIEIRIPESTQDVELLDNLLNYVLPSGYTYSIIKSKVETITYNTRINEYGSTTTNEYTSYALGRYSSEDNYMKSYKINNTSEVGMSTVVSAKDLEAVLHIASETSLNENEE